MGKRNKSSLETQTNSQQLNNKQREIFCSILFYCLLIIVSPILTFFASKHLIFDTILEPLGSNISAAVSAVVAIHISLGLFLYRAYFSEETYKPTSKQD